jgi:hypothetical protein
MLVMVTKGRMHSSYLSIVHSSYLSIVSVLAPAQDQISGSLLSSSIYRHEAKLCTYVAQKLGMLDCARNSISLRSERTRHPVR